MKRNKMLTVLLTYISLTLLSSCKTEGTGMLSMGDFEKPETELEGEEDTSKIYASLRLFEQGKEGYHSYRIPSLCRSNNGNLIALVEGRKHTSLDYGDIDIVSKISTDNGKTWSALKVVIGTGEGTWGNPTIVNDEEKGRVWLFVSWNSEFHSQNGGSFNGKDYPAVSKWGDRKVYSLFSDDNGLTWTTPVDRTEELLPKDFIWDAVGPGSGIQIAQGPNKGRLIIPAGERNIYSDDHGETWKYQRIPKNTFEGSIVELSSGLLMRNDRAVLGTWNRGKFRYISKGNIEGGFSNFIADSKLIDPRCQGSILRLSFQPNLIAFLNPATNDGDGMPNRCHMTLRLSNDDGKSWYASKKLEYEGIEPNDLCALGYGGYTSMTRINDKELALMVEQVNQPTAGAAINRRHSIDFQYVNVNWISKP